MTQCPDLDDLTSVLAAITWQPDRLDHVQTCRTCRRHLAELAATHAVLAGPSAELPPGFVRQVATSLGTTGAPPAGRMRVAAAVALAIAVGATTMVALLATAGPDGAGLGPLMAGSLASVASAVVARR